MDKELYRLFSAVDVEVEKADGQKFTISMVDNDVSDYVRILLNTKRFMTITIKAKDGEPDAR